VRRIVVTALAAALVALAVASVIAARERLSGRRLSLAPTSRQRRLASALQERTDAKGSIDEAFVKWIPIVVPLTALVLVLGAYLILAALAF
jgi:hypothetical protein